MPPRVRVKRARHRFAPTLASLLPSLTSRPALHLLAHARTQTPTWTVLNATADIGTRTLVLNGLVNWVPGDRIVVASSSFFADEVRATRRARRGIAWTLQ